MINECNKLVGVMFVLHMILFFFSLWIQVNKEGLGHDCFHSIAQLGNPDSDA